MYETFLNVFNILLVNTTQVKPGNVNPLRKIEVQYSFTTLLLWKLMSTLSSWALVSIRTNRTKTKTKTKTRPLAARSRMMKDSMGVQGSESSINEQVKCFSNVPQHHLYYFNSFFWNKDDFLSISLLNFSTWSMIMKSTQKQQ